MGATTEKPRKVKNPVSASTPELRPCPWLDPRFPVKPWIRASQEATHAPVEFETASIQQDDGTYVAIIVSDPSFRFTAKTQKQAEQGVIQLYAADFETDAEDIRIARERLKQPAIPWEEVKRKHRL